MPQSHITDQTMFQEEDARPPDKSAYLKIIFSYFSTKTYVVGTQKIRLDETLLLNTQNVCLNWWIRW